MATTVQRDPLTTVTREEIQQWFLDQGFKLVRESSCNLYKWVTFPNGVVYMRVCFKKTSFTIERRSTHRYVTKSKIDNKKLPILDRFVWSYWAGCTYKATKKSGPRLLVGAAWLDGKTFK